MLILQNLLADPRNPRTITAEAADEILDGAARLLGERNVTAVDVAAILGGEAEGEGEEPAPRHPVSDGDGEVGAVLAVPVGFEEPPAFDDVPG